MVAMFSADFLRHYREHCGTDKFSEYICIEPAVKRLHDLYCDHEAAAFAPIGFKAVRQAMIDGGWSRPNVNSCMKKVKRAFKWAASEGKIPASVS
jgi:hypothetical protein